MSLIHIWYTGWPTKMSLFFFGNNFYKNKETFNNFSPQILEVYRILLVATALESITFYYTFSVINTMFVPCTALLYDSTAATRTLKLPTTLFSISCGICLISFLSVDCCPKLCPSGTPSENSQVSWYLGNRMGKGCQFDAKWVCHMESYAWGIQVFWFEKVFWWRLFSRTEHLNTSGITSYGTDSFHIKLATTGHPIPKISTHLTIFWGGTWKTEFVKTILRQERAASEEKSDEFHKKCSIELWTILMFELLLCCHTAVRCMERT